MFETLSYYFNKIYSFGESYLSAGFMRLLAIYAFLNLTYKGAGAIYLIYQRFLAPQKNLLQRYGHKSWAVITGGAEGIGRGFARELAKWEFNLVIIDYQEELLKKTCDELMMAYPTIQVKPIVADFRNSAKEGFYDELHEKIGDLDISILVNNVGACIVQPFAQNDEKAMRELMLINMFPAALMTRKLLPNMLLRPKRSAVIMVSSEESIVKIAGFSLYGATKVFMEYLAHSLIEEYGDRIDFLSIHPALVSTRLVKFVDPGFHPITPEECAAGSLKKLGRLHKTYGGWRHEIMNGLANNMMIFKKLYVADLYGRMGLAAQRNQELGIKA